MASASGSTLMSVVYSGDGIRAPKNCSKRALRVLLLPPSGWQYRKSLGSSMSFVDLLANARFSAQISL